MLQVGLGSLPERPGTGPPGPQRALVRRPGPPPCPGLAWPGHAGHSSLRRASSYFISSSGVCILKIRICNLRANLLRKSSFAPLLTPTGRKADSPLPVRVDTDWSASVLIPSPGSALCLSDRTQPASRVAPRGAVNAGCSGSNGGRDAEWCGFEVPCASGPAVSCHFHPGLRMSPGLVPPHPAPRL